MFDYKTFQDIHVFFQQELDLAKSNLEKAKKNDALNFDGFIEPNERVFKFYEEVDRLYIEALFYDNIKNEEELLKEAIDWLTEASKDLVKFNRFCSEAREMGDLKESIKLTDILLEMMLDEDRCKRIADRRYDKPSAYKSGAIVRCRKGKIWKGIKEDQINELGENDIHYKNILSYFDTSDNITKSIILNLLNSKNRDILIQNLRDLGYKDALEIEQELGIKGRAYNIDEAKKETLRTWFKRKGAPGKTGGWVDCNTCREVDGKTKCKPCGRKKGEKRAKYPSCRPTPSACKQPGKGKKWGKII